MIESSKIPKHRQANSIHSPGWTHSIWSVMNKESEALFAFIANNRSYLRYYDCIACAMQIFWIIGSHPSMISLRHSDAIQESLIESMTLPRQVENHDNLGVSNAS